MNTDDLRTSPLHKATNNVSAMNDIRGFQVADWITRHHRHAYKTQSAYFFASVLMNSFYNPNKGYAYPTQEQLAEMLGMSVRQVGRLVEILKSSGGGTLWKVSRGFKTPAGSMANRYYPLFLDEIRTRVPSIWTLERVDVPPAETEGSESENPQQKVQQDTAEVIEPDYPFLLPEEPDFYPDEEPPAPDYDEGSLYQDPHRDIPDYYYDLDGKRINA